MTVFLYSLHSFFRKMYATYIFTLMTKMEFFHQMAKYFSLEMAEDVSI